LFRANKLVGVPVAWVTNPLTIAPIFYGNYVVGAYLVPGGHVKTWAHWQQLAARVFSPGQGMLERGREILSMAVDIALPLWVGSLIVGLFVGGLSYWVTYTAVVRARRRLAARRAKKAAIRAAAVVDGDVR
jgi:uncharacterized protein (DUF2062 family)